MESGAKVALTTCRAVREGQAESLAHDLASRTSAKALALGTVLPPPRKNQGYLQRLAKSPVPEWRSDYAEMVADKILYLLPPDFLAGAIIRLDRGDFFCDFGGRFTGGRQLDFSQGNLLPQPAPCNLLLMVWR